MRTRFMTCGMLAAAITVLTIRASAVEAGAEDSDAGEAWARAGRRFVLDPFNYCGDASSVCPHLRWTRVERRL